MGIKHNFRNLKVWQKSVDLAVNIYEISKSFPNEEKFGITSQIRRSSVSISSNIAESTSKKSVKAILNSLDISLGESFELETQVLIAFRTGLLDLETHEQLKTEIVEVQRMISGFSVSIKNSET